ncbi:Microtubule-associated protein, partial [Schistosoma japonicum]
GLTLEYAIRENIFIRVLFNPTSDQLRFSLQEAFNHAIGNNGDSVIEYPVTPSTMGKVSIVYNGQLNGFTGDWLLQDSSFSGSNLLSWLDSEAAMLIKGDNILGDL